MKTLKLLMMVNQVLQSQGVNRIPCGMNFEVMVPQEGGDSGMGYRENHKPCCVLNGNTKMAQRMSWN